MLIGLHESEIEDDKSSDENNSPLGREMGNTADSLELDDGSFDSVPWIKGELIGKGQMGKVYKGINKTSGELLAIKEITLDKYDNSIIEQISNELAILKTIRHPNIVYYYTTQIIKGTATAPAYINIVMEYVSGGSIANIIKDLGPIPEKSCKSFTHQLMLGLEFLHEKGITHRDIKCANILLTDSGVVKLTDFGTSCSIFDDAETRNIQIGTPQWCAPEALKNQLLPKEWRKADVWSLGCTIIEMITGKPPWGEFSDPQTAIYKIATAGTAPPLPTNISNNLTIFLNKCFILDPKNRPDIHRLLMEKWVFAEEKHRIKQTIDVYIYYFIRDHKLLELDQNHMKKEKK